MNIITPISSFLKKTYYIKNNVVFKISSIRNYTDSCALNISEETKNNLPQFVVTQSDGTEKTYYLDVLISDGDKYVSNKFSKLAHNETASSEEYMSYIKYYGLECEAFLKNLIASHPKYSKEDIETLLLRYVPSYMLKGKADYINSTNEGENIQNILIDMNNFKQYKREVALEMATSAANSTLSNFGYKVDTLTIKDTEVVDGEPISSEIVNPHDGEYTGATAADGEITSPSDDVFSGRNDDWQVEAP